MRRKPSWFIRISPQAVLPALKTALEEKGVEIRGCDATRKIIEAKPATEQDWRTEYLDLILSIKVVDSHGPGH